MEDKLYINEKECVIYKDGKLHAITLLSDDEEKFIKELKAVFPESDIVIFGFKDTYNGEISRIIRSN